MNFVDKKPQAFLAVAGILTICTMLVSGLNAESTGQGPVLDGNKKSFVVVGYSTSYQWPGILQKMLDEHAGKEGTYKMLNAAVSGSSVGKWLGITGEEHRQRTFDAMVNSYFEPGEKLEGAHKPSVALLQQSLQFVYEERTDGIRSADDSERIKIGADAFMKLAGQIHDLGVETVFISTHIYKKPMEPAIENERYALREVLERDKKFIRAGPELWEPTKAVYPDGFREDTVHPNIIGARIMAIGWYKTLAGSAAKKSIIEKADNGALDVEVQKPGRGSKARGTTRAARR